MDVTDLLKFLLIQSRFLQHLWLLSAGRAVLALWLLLIAGFAFAQWHRRPQTMRWFLTALGLTIVWEGGAGAVLMPHIAGLGDDGSSDISHAETAFEYLAWYVCPLAVRCVATLCLLKAAFGEADTGLAKETV